MDVICVRGRQTHFVNGKKPIAEMAQMEGMKLPQLCTIINPYSSTFYKFLSDHSYSI